MHMLEYDAVKDRKTGLIGIVCDIHTHIDGRIIYVVERLDEEKTGILSEDIVDCLEENLINLNGYTDKPFAMEVLSGKVLSLRTELQKSLVYKTTIKLNLSISELGKFLINHIDGEEDENLKDDESLSDKYGFLMDYTGEELEEIFGFDEVNEKFTYPGIKIFRSNYGWSVKGILEELGYTLAENIDEYPNIHNADGVIYCDMI